MFKTATQGLEEKYDLSLKNAKSFLDDVEEASSKFYWGPVFCKMYTEPNDISVTKHMITDMPTINLEQVMTNARVTWTKGDLQTTSVDDSEANPDFLQRRIRASMIGEWLLASITKAAKKKLMQKKKFYQYQNTDGDIENDGPTMFKILYDLANPTTRAGYIEIKKNLGKYNLKDFDFNVNDMLAAMQDDYEEIILLGGKHDDYLLDIFSALSTVDCSEFNMVISGILSDFHRGTDITPDFLSSEATTKYNNMVTAASWKKKAVLKDGEMTSDSKKHIMTLTTKIDELEKKLSQSSFNQSGGGSNSGEVKGIANWRKTKTHGDEVFKDGKQWYWCTRHKRDGDYDGLYVTHKEESHDEAVARWNFRKKNGSVNETSGAKTPGGDAVPKLKVQENLKKILFTCGVLDETQIDNIVSESMKDF